MSSRAPAAGTPKPPAAPAIRAFPRRVAGWLRGVPVEAVLVGLGLFVLLAVFVNADPPSQMTYSIAPFTDEAFNAVNSRNLIQVGQWGTDEWTRHLVELPFSVLEAVTFKFIGVGIVQARLPMILCVSLTATALVWGLRRPVGRVWAVFAGLAFAGSGLVLLYGRLVFFENLVVLCLTLGTLVLVRESRLGWRGGILAGICYALAIGTKPNAAFPVLGILVALGLAWGWRDRSLRRWLAGVAVAIGLSGLLWLIAIWLPNRAAIAIDLSTWPPFHYSLSPGAFLESVRLYLFESDKVIGMLLGPLVFLALAGVAAIVALRRRLTGMESRLAVAAFGWAAFGFGILMVVDYRPNRYVVPLVPALAILAAIGLHVLGQWLTERLRDGEPGRPGLLRRNALPILATAAVLVAVAPGLGQYARWARNVSYDLVGIQARFESLVPAGERVAGRESALFLMTSRNVTIIVGLANKGDLYATGVRWYLVPVTDPAPNGVPDGAWSARQTVACADWAGATECLFHVP